jgi:DNA-binding NarL/FixJ family response regulator
MFRASESLLASSIASLIRDLVPEASVRFTEMGPAGGIRIDLEGTSRWMLIMDRNATVETAAEALAAGASGLLPFDCDMHEFSRALTALIEDDSPYVASELLRKIAEETIRQRGSDNHVLEAHVKLTARENEVLELVAMGYSNREIAEKLVVSVNTVRTHLQSLSLKLEASGRTRMLAKARQVGLLEPRPPVNFGQTKLNRVS